MSYRHTFETTAVTLDGNQIKVEAIVKVFGSIAEQVSLDEVLALEDFDPAIFGDGPGSEPAISAGEDIMDRLSRKERDRLEASFEASSARSWQSVIYGTR